MASTASVQLTEEEITYMADAMDDQVRHWELCGGTDEENARYQRTIAAYQCIARKLDEALALLEDN